MKKLIIYSYPTKSININILQIMTPLDKYGYAAVLGFFTSNILSFLGVMTGQEAVDYYAEVHLSTWNSFIHTIGMPFTYMGFNLAVPALFGITNSWNMQMCFYIAYMVHYATIDFQTAVVTSYIYYHVISDAHKLYMKKFTSRVGYFFLGLGISTVALLCQEFFGHYIGGDDPSRAEGVLNAILYAKFYSVQHVIDIIRYGLF